MESLKISTFPEIELRAVVSYQFNEEIAFGLFSPYGLAG
jgi:hypothetical protein